RLEQVVLQDEVPRVRPVVGDVAGPLRADRVVRILLATLAPRQLGLGDEAVHLAAAHVRNCVRLTVRPARVQITRVVERSLTVSFCRVRKADGEATVRRPWKSVRTGIRTEVVIEGAVL